MCRTLLALSALVLGSNLATAEPLPWSYYVRFQAAGNADTILLGTDSRPNGMDQPATPVYLTYQTGGFGPSRINYQTAIGTEALYTFGYGDWTVSETPPPAATTSPGTFDLFWGFQPPNSSNAVSGVFHGTISASGIYTTGSGNFSLSLDESVDLDLDGRRARVRFAASNNESVSRIDMTVTALDVAETPEPATALLAGIGLAGVGLRRKWRTM